MHKVFVPLYRFFHNHKALMYIIMIVSTLAFLFFGLQLHYEEDIEKGAVPEKLLNTIVNRKIRL